MRLLILILVFASLVGCGDPNKTRVIEKNESYCTMGSSEKRADFILKCIANANPKSDEEPEDWITKCQDMAENTLCEKRTMQITQRCGSSGNCWWIEVSRKPKQEK